MVQKNPSDFVVFFDDGGVMNDNRLRGIQWQKLVGEFFSPKFGGELHKWAEGNFEFITRFIAEEEISIERGEITDYLDHYSNFQNNWITNMFEYVGIEVPQKELHSKIYLEAINYITPNVKAAFPGSINTIKKLHNLGFRLSTASAEHSTELKGYLRGMRVVDCFEKFYGSDLINTHKSMPNFYDKIFEDINLDPRRAIIIEDNPRYLENAERSGANVIQACLTKQHKPEFTYHVEDMNNLPEIVLKLIKKIKK
jgi:HAD superfamily hydrolase (TIGR01509 family)